MVVELIQPDTDAVRYIAENMRQSDIDEVWASNNHTPLEALVNGWENSHGSLIVQINGDPCVMLGLVRLDFLSGHGTPWLLGTDSSLKYKREFLKQVPAVIEEMLGICQTLSNYVHVNNSVSIRWLKRIGFTICEPEVYGVEGEMFHRFYLEKGD